MYLYDEFCCVVCLACKHISVRPSPAPLLPLTAAPPYHQLYPNTNKTILVLRIHLIASGSISSRLSQRRLVKKDLHRESIARHNTSPHTTNLLPQHHIRLSCSLLDSTNTLSSRWKSHRELKRFSPRKESLSRTQQ